MFPPAVRKVDGTHDEASANTDRAPPSIMRPSRLRERASVAGKEFTLSP